MNNVLGNVIETDIDSAKKARDSVITNAHRAMKRSGVAVFSVYNRAYLPSHSVHVATRAFAVTPSSRPESGDLVIEYTDPTGDILRYYSHWFTGEEIQSALSCGGMFSVVSLQERDSRLIAVAIRR